MSKQNPTPLTTEQRQQIATIIFNQSEQLVDKALYHTSVSSNKWQELGITSNPKNQIQMLIDFMKQKKQTFKKSKQQLTIQHVSQYQTQGLKYLIEIKGKINQIINKTAILKSNKTKTWQYADSMETNMKKVVKSLETAEADFNLIRRTFLTNNNHLANSNHSIRSRQNLDLSRISSNSSQANNTTYDMGVYKVISANNRTGMQKTVTNNSFNTQSYTNTYKKTTNINQYNYSKDIPNNYGLSINNPVKPSPYTAYNQYSYKAESKPTTNQATTTITRPISQHTLQAKTTQTQRLHYGIRNEETSHTTKREEISTINQTQIQNKIKNQYETIIHQKNTLLEQKQHHNNTLNKQIQIAHQSLKKSQQKIIQLEQTIRNQKAKQQTEKRNQLLNDQKLQQENKQLKTQLQQIRLKNQSQTRQFKPLQDKIYSTRQQLSTLEEQSARLKKNIEEAKKQYSNQKQDIQLKSHQVKTKNEEVERLSGEVTKLNRFIEKDVSKKVVELFDELNSIDRDGRTMTFTNSPKDLKSAPTMQEELIKNLTHIKTQVALLKTQFTQSAHKIKVKTQQLTTIEQKTLQATKRLTSLDQQLNKKQKQVKNIRLDDGTVMSYEKLLKQKAKQEKDFEKQMKQMREDYLEKREEYENKIEEKRKKLQTQLPKLQQEYDKKLRLKKQQIKAEEIRLQELKQQFTKILRQKTNQTLNKQQQTQKLTMESYLSTLKQIISTHQTSPQPPAISHQNHAQMTQLSQQLQTLRQMRDGWAGHESKLQRQIQWQQNKINELQGVCRHLEHLLNERDECIQKLNYERQSTLKRLDQIPLTKTFSSDQTVSSASFNINPPFQAVNIIQSEPQPVLGNFDSNFKMVSNEKFGKSQSLQTVQYNNNQHSNKILNPQIENVSKTVNSDFDKKFYALDNTLIETAQQPAKPITYNHHEIHQIQKEKQALENQQNQLGGELQRIDDKLNLLKNLLQKQSTFYSGSLSSNNSRNSSSSYSSRIAELEGQREEKIFSLQKNEERLKQINSILAPLHNSMSMSDQEERFI